MSDSHGLTDLRTRRTSLLNQLNSLADFRAGTLVGRYRKCGKPNCRCAREGESGHGPSWSLTRSVNDKTVTKIISAEAVDATNQQIAEYHRFEKIVDELVEINVRICDALLEADDQDDPEGAKKGGSTAH